VVKASWGIKRACRKCNTNFYDLKKDPIECPKCFTTYSLSDFISKYVKSSEGRDKRESKKVAAVLDEAVLVDDVSLDVDLGEDDTDLEEDMGAVIDCDGSDKEIQN
jgi:uncharacterized protein (TIGR02300 family)